MPSPLTRDQGLDRISHVTRLVVAGALVVAGLFTALVAKAVPGRATTATPATSNPSTTTVGNSNPSSGGTGAENSGSATANQSTTLAPPVEAPAPTPAPAAVSSGGS